VLFERRTNSFVKINEHPIDDALFVGQYKTIGTAVIFNKYRCIKCADVLHIPLTLYAIDGLRRVSLTALSPYLKNNRIVVVIGSGKEVMMISLLHN